MTRTDLAAFELHASARDVPENHARVMASSSTQNSAVSGALVPCRCTHYCRGQCTCSGCHQGFGGDLMPSQHTVLHNHFAALHKMIKDAKRKKYGPGDMVRVAKPPPGEAGELWPRVDVPVFLETVHTDGTVTVAWVAAGSTTYTRKRAVARALRPPVPLQMPESYAKRIAAQAYLIGGVAEVTWRYKQWKRCLRAKQAERAANQN